MHDGAISSCCSVCEPVLLMIIHTTPLPYVCNDVAGRKKVAKQIQVPTMHVGHPQGQISFTIRSVFEM